MTARARINRIDTNVMRTRSGSNLLREAVQRAIRRIDRRDIRTI
ncbi:hypothetical protein IWX77_003504, partial [Cryobacterium sp. CAN_C2]